MIFNFKKLFHKNNKNLLIYNKNVLFFNKYLFFVEIEVVEVDRDFWHVCPRNYRLS